MIIRFLALILICQLIGETVNVATGIPVPGPVIGMAILFAGLLVRRGLPQGLNDTAGGLLKHLALLFVPAGVGVMLHVPRLADEWWPVFLAIVPGTLIAIVITALVMERLGRATLRPEDKV
ncbi:CidA/LrgA family protein [Thalassospiraceae bacterium LMO-JJ14]|nr:CidA/LrgA family protein [Thalassospiraceae bacterium LMO-JJ14]